MSLLLGIHHQAMVFVGTSDEIFSDIYALTAQCSNVILDFLRIFVGDYYRLPVG